MAQHDLGKVSIRPRGAYAANTNYEFLDSVQNLGGSWLALAASKDVQPGVTAGWQNYWMMITRGIKTIVGSSPADGQTQITITFTDGATATYTYNNEVLADGSVTAAKLAALAVETAKIKDKAVTMAKLADHAVSVDYTVTLNTTWSGSAAPYTKEQTINGILATDKPLIDIVPSATFADAEKQADAWALIYRAVTAANKITFYAKAKPTVSIPLQIRCIRK